MKSTNYNRCEVGLFIKTITEKFGTDQVHWIPTRSGFAGSFGTGQSQSFFKYYDDKRTMVLDSHPGCPSPRNVTNSSPAMAIMGLHADEESNALYGEIIDSLSEEKVLSYATEMILNSVEAISGNTIANIIPGTNVMDCIIKDRPDIQKMSLTTEQGRFILTYYFFTQNDEKAQDKLGQMITEEIFELVDDIKYVTGAESAGE